MSRDRAIDLEGGAHGKLVVRAEKLKIALLDSPLAGTVSAPGIVEAVDYQGQVVRYFVRVGELQLQAIDMIDGHPFAEGGQVAVCIRPGDCTALPEGK